MNYLFGVNEVIDIEGGPDVEVTKIDGDRITLEIEYRIKERDNYHPRNAGKEQITVTRGDTIHLRNGIRLIVGQNGDRSSSSGVTLDVVWSSKRK